MNILKDTIKPNEQTHNIEAITDVKLIGSTYDNSIIFKYTLSGELKYIIYQPMKRNMFFIFFEIINKSPLWKIEFNNISTRYGVNIEFNISIADVELIPDFINISLGLNFILMEQFSKLPSFTTTDFSKKSYVPYIENVKVDSGFKLKLYSYQEKSLGQMLLREKNNIDTINYTSIVNLFDNEIIFDPIKNIKIDTHENFLIQTKGGVLSDEMGLGKTISSIALIYKNPRVITQHIQFNKIASKATVIICPSHLIKQWEDEIKRCNDKFKILVIGTKKNYASLKFKDFIDSDIIITSHQFIMNIKYYPTLYYKLFTMTTYQPDDRIATLNSLLDDIIKKPIEEIKKLDLPLFEFFHFHRLILDEGHEIFGEYLGTQSLSRYMSNWLINLTCNYYWYISGTPFINLQGIRNCARFIKLQLIDKVNNINIDFSTYSFFNYSSRHLNNFLDKEYLWDNILEKICIRHRKEDVVDQVSIPGFVEQLIWVKFTEMERQLYDTKKHRNCSEYLQQLCCHPLIVDSTKKIFGNEVDLNVMQDKLIDFHRKNIEIYTDKLSKIDTRNQAYYMIKKSYETQISESKYMLNIFDKLKSKEINSDENCAVCLDNIIDPALTACGHLYCYECIKRCLVNTKVCPTCRTNLVGKDLLVINKKSEDPTLNPLIDKYGSKLGKLISMIRVLTTIEETRIIIFSQWDDMLRLIGRSLAENNIGNSFVKGNVWCRNSAISKFKSGKNTSGDDNKVIMLSLKNSASGTNLTEATHIFFVEPIDAPKEKCRAIEGQAIARACRVGQKNKIVVNRILVENSIEEIIYRKSYDKDVVVEIDN